MKLLNPIPDRDTMLQFERLAHVDQYNAAVNQEIISFFNRYIHRREVCSTCPDKIAIARKDIKSKWDLYGAELKAMFPSVEEQVQATIKADPDPYTSEWLQQKLDEHGMHKRIQKDLDDYKSGK